MQLRDEVGSLGDDRIEGLLASQALRNVLNLLSNIFKVMFMSIGRRDGWSPKVGEHGLERSGA